MASVEIKNLTKKYEGGKTVAAENMTLRIEDGEFFVLLGPSGCGKTTTLRSIAGLLKPDEGVIKIGEKVVLDSKNNKMVSPGDRNIAMVFQQYAIYPHMTVRDNIGFPLTVRKTDKKEKEEKVRKVARMLGIEELLNRKPGQLSGGQRQRVALGRALVMDPQVYLFDEPLANLDAKLRDRMRGELKELHRKMKNTYVFVTHDQVEAMNMADRIMVMNEGKCVQLGTPDDLFLRPKDVFVAGFIGTPRMNFADVTVTEEKGKLMFASEDLKIPVPSGMKKELKNHIGKEITIAIRPSRIRITDTKGKTLSPNYVVKGKVSIVEPMGETNLVHVYVGKHRIIVEEDEKRPGEGSEAFFELDPKRIHVYDKKTGEVIAYALANRKS